MSELVEPIAMVEGYAQKDSGFLLKSAEEDDVSVPMYSPERPAPVSLDEGDGEWECQVRDVGERGRESASQMVARMLSAPSTPSRPSLAHEGQGHSSCFQRLPDEFSWEPSEPRSDPPEEHPVTEDAARLQNR